MQTDGKDKQDQPEFLYEMQRVIIDRLAEMPDENAGKEHAGRAEPNAAKLEAAERHAHHAYERQHAHGVRDRLRFVKFEEPAHSFEKLTVPVAMLAGLSDFGLTGIVTAAIVSLKFASKSGYQIGIIPHLAALLKKVAPGLHVSPSATGPALKR